MYFICLFVMVTLVWYSDDNYETMMMELQE